MAVARAVTELLQDWRAGDKQALGELTPLVYEELRRLAARHMRSERHSHTLQATALVHEAFIRMAGMDVPWADRAHFYAVASRLMRRILVDHAKAHRSNKRGGGEAPCTLDEEHFASQGPLPADILVIDEALSRLERLDARKSDIVILHFFGGLTYDETAEALGISAATVHRDLRLGKAWLLNELEIR